MDDERVIAAAYHEAGHVVVAAVNQEPQARLVDPFALRPRGISICRCGGGSTFFVEPYPFCRPRAGSREERRVFNMITTLFAGLSSQKYFYPQSSDLAARDDEEQIKFYLFGICAGTSVDEASVRQELMQRSVELVKEKSKAIEAVAEALLAVDWTAKDAEETWCHKCTDQRTISGSNIIGILRGHDMCAVMAPADLPDWRQLPQRQPIAD